MVKAIIELMLGRVGRFFLAAYDEYSVFLNAIVIVYGVALIWAHMNLRREMRRMEDMMLDLAQNGEQGTKQAPEQGHDAQAVFEAFVQRWKTLQEGRKIVIPSRNDLWFSVLDSADLIETLKIQPEYVRVVLSKATDLEPAESGPNPTRRVWERYRHQLLIGIRARHMEPEVQLKMREGGSRARGG